MEVTFDRAAITPHQALLAERIGQVLGEWAQFERAVEPDAGNGPSVEFEIRTRYPDLTVSLVLYQDSYHLFANEAEVRIEMEGYKDYETWADDVEAITANLFFSPLHVRVKKPLLRFFPAEGAILISVDGTTRGWGGNIAFGGGRETVFEDWFVRPDPESDAR